MTVQHIYDFLNTVSPFAAADKFDNVGLLVGNRNNVVTGIATCLDITNDVVTEAIDKNANLIISHHPVIFDPMKSVLAGSPVYKMIQNGISAICCHTNLDMTEGGVSDLLLEMLGFESSEVYEVVHENGLGYGGVCDLSFGFTSKSLAEHVKKALDLPVVRYCGDNDHITRVAVCCGAGGSTLPIALAKHCDALITGDVKHNIWIDAVNSRLTLIDAGHYGTEHFITHRLAALLSRHFAETPVYASDSSKDPCNYLT